MLKLFRIFGIILLAIVAGVITGLATKLFTNNTYLLIALPLLCFICLALFLSIHLYRKQSTREKNNQTNTLNKFTIWILLAAGILEAVQSLLFHENQSQKPMLQKILVFIIFFVTIWHWRTGNEEPKTQKMLRIILLILLTLISIYDIFTL